MTVQATVIVSTELVNVMRVMKEKIAQKLLVLRKVVQNLVYLNVYNFVLMFIKPKVLLHQNNVTPPVTKNVLEIVLQLTRIPEKLLHLTCSYFSLRGVTKRKWK